MVKTCKEEEAEIGVKRKCNHLFKISKKDLINNDVYQQSQLIYVINDNDLELFNMIIQHPSFDRHKTDVEKALFTAISQNRKEMYHELIQISKDEFHTYNFNDENVFICANNDALNDLFNSTQIKLSKEEIENCFNQSVNTLIDINTDSSFDVLSTVIKYDREHDSSIDINKLLPNGKTLLTSLFDLTNAVEFAKFLLENGANPNIQDLGGNLPLEIAINNDNSKFVHVLIDSKKADFNKKFHIKAVFYTPDFKPIGGINKTYLHLAARLNDPTILKELLNCKFIDANSTDECGETPLIEACRMNLSANITKLFKMVDLDYLHCNNEGKDALQILSNSSSPTQIKDKNEYLQKLLSFINKPKSTPRISPRDHDNFNDIMKFKRFKYGLLSDNYEFDEKYHVFGENTRNVFPNW